MNAEAYDYLRNVPIGGWTWEFARRLSAYADAHTTHRQGALQYIELPCGMEIINLSRPEPEAAKYGLSFFVSPRRNCLEAPVFWTEDANHNVATVVVRAAKSGQLGDCRDGLFNLSNLRCRRTIFIDHEGNQQLRLVYRRRTIQLKCEGDCLLSGDVDLYFMLKFFGPVDAKMETLTRLLHLYEGYLPERPVGREWTVSALGYRDALIALDVYLAGGSHRDTAKIIYGEEAGSARYSESDESVRNKMRRLRKKGIHLMNGGYLDLMKKRGSVKV